jgi:PAS domain S-box-containing protein
MIPTAHLVLDMALQTTWKVVVIDDEDDIREVLRLSLQDSGYEVATAADGASGLRLCSDLQPQVVITDVRMPGISGIEVLERVKNGSPDTEVIVVTAFGEMDLAIRALQLDASDFITKPISNQALNLALDRATSRYDSRKRLQEYTKVLEAQNAATSHELLQSISFQKKLIEGSMDGILGCDETERVVICNQSMADMCGYAKADVVRKMALADFFDADTLARFEEALAGETYGGRNRLLLFEGAIAGRSGLRIPVQMSATAVVEERHRSSIVCYFRDLRKIRELETEMADQAHILHQDKMMSLGRLAASVVHEINNPLAGILNYLRLMQRIIGKAALTRERLEKFARYLDLVETETDRCSKIVSNLLGFARMAPPQMGTVSLEDLIHRSTLLCGHKLELSNIQLEVDLQNGLPPVAGDFNQLQQCVINLVFNAIDAMPEGGVLKIAVRHAVDHHLVTIYFRDTGSGIAPENLPHIFEPFFTTKPVGHGVGLGLSTVYGIIEQHGGAITAHSSQGRGSEFVIELPAGPDPAGASSNPPSGPTDGQLLA